MRLRSQLPRDQSADANPSADLLHQRLRAVYALAQNWRHVFTLRLPAAWPDEQYQHTVEVLLQRFLWRYRAFQAYGQHL